MQDIKDGYKKWKDKTSTSTSNRHLGHYKSLLATDGTSKKDQNTESSTVPSSNLFFSNFVKLSWLNNGASGSMIHILLLAWCKCLLFPSMVYFYFGWLCYSLPMFRRSFVLSVVPINGRIFWNINVFYSWLVCLFGEYSDDFSSFSFVFYYYYY